MFLDTILHCFCLVALTTVAEPYQMRLRLITDEYGACALYLRAVFIAQSTDCPLLLGTRSLWPKNPARVSMPQPFIHITSASIGVMPDAATGRPRVNRCIRQGLTALVAPCCAGRSVQLSLLTAAEAICGVVTRQGGGVGLWGSCRG